MTAETRKERYDDILPWGWTPYSVPSWFKGDVETQSKKVDLTAKELDRIREGLRELIADSDRVAGNSAKWADAYRVAHIKFSQDLAALLDSKGDVETQSEKVDLTAKEGEK